MWPALVWERAIMKESKNLTSGGIVSHTGSRKEHPSLRKVIDLWGRWIWIATPWRNERACRHLIEISIGAEAEISIEAE